MTRLVYVLFISITFFQSILAKPNIILFLTDDQDLLLDGMTPMKNTIDIIANKGVTFENAFVNSPICCPSRSSLLTGRYAHNTKVWNNSISGGCSSSEWQHNLEPQSVAALLKANAQYRTFYAGKYLNQYGKKASGNGHQVPIGWDSWFGLIGNSKYYNYSLSENGKLVHYTDSYLTDVIRDKAVEFLQQYKNSEQPLFMILAPPAPHAPATAASRHQNHFPGAKAPCTPAFNISAANKHWLVQQTPSPLPGGSPTLLNYVQRCRLRSLLAVDELVADVVAQLSEQQLSNTYLLYTSDNGYHIGQFSLPWDKRQPYDTDVRVPLLLRGPDLPVRFVSSLVVQTVDLAPTMLSMAGIVPPSTMDGRSFLNVSLEEQNRVDVLLEYRGEGNALTNDPTCPGTGDDNLAECGHDSWCKCQDARNNTYNCIRRLSPNEDFLYCRFADSDNFVEAYDLRYDKYQLNNIYKSMNSREIEEYENSLDKLSKCQGMECRSY